MTKADQLMTLADRLTKLERQEFVSEVLAAATWLMIIASLVLNIMTMGVI